MHSFTLSSKIEDFDVRGIEQEAQIFFDEHRNVLENFSGERMAQGGADTSLLKGFWGHGITRGQPVDQLKAVFVIAETGFISGDTAEFGSAYINPYTDGSAFVISRPGAKLLLQGGDSAKTLSRNLVSADGEKKWGLAAEIGAIVLNPALYPVAEELKAKFPNVTIVRANELSELLKKWENESSV